jgi:hypothetical protein
MIDVKIIKDLEKKYMNKIWTLVSSNEFIINLKSIEEFIINNYIFLHENWDEKNKIKVGVERLIRFHIYKNFNVLNIYPSPISSDMAVELEDVLLNIDAKTIDMEGNPGDDTAIHFQKNQITFDNDPFFKQKINGFQFSGITFPSRLEKYYKKKPVLTFFVTVNYRDKPSKRYFKLSHLSVCSVPHDEIVKVDYSNNIISNFKTHEYIGKSRAEDIGLIYLPKKRIEDHWIPFSIKGNGTNDAFLDPNLNNPIIKNSKAVWKLIGGQYSILTYGGSARIDKTKIKNRLDSKGELWSGYLKKDIK